MEDNRSRSKGSSREQKPGAKSARRDSYELDLDEHAPSDLDRVIEDAVAAVDRVSGEKQQAGDGGASDGDNGKDRAQLDSEVKSLRERLMRTLADFDNYRKRTEREKQSLERFAIFDVVQGFVGVVDNLERAVEASGSAEDLKQGVHMIIRQQEEVLKRHGVEKIESVGKPFDPTVHEAVGREESTEIDVPTVTSELQPGYLLHDRLLRPAMVHVAMPVTDPGERGAKGDSGKQAKGAEQEVGQSR